MVRVVGVGIERGVGFFEGDQSSNRTRGGNRRPSRGPNKPSEPRGLHRWRARLGYEETREVAGTDRQGLLAEIDSVQAVDVLGRAGEDRGNVSSSRS